MTTENADRRVATTTDKQEKKMVFIPFAADSPIELSINLVKSTLCKPTKTGRRCSDSDAIRFMMMCKSRGLNPWEGDAFLVGYDTRTADGTIIPEFNLITAHQAFLKRAEVHPEFEGMESGVILCKEESTEPYDREGDFFMPNEVLVGGWAVVYKKGKKPTKRRLRLSTFAKETKVWKENPAGMIVKTAEADSLRSAFPTKMGGMYLAEEFQMPINIDSTVTEIPMNRLVATTDEPADDHQTTQQDGAQTSQESPSEVQADKRVNPAQVKANSPQDKLGRFCAENAVTFDQFQKWALESENVAGADSIEGFAGVPTVDAERLMRAPKAMLHQIGGVKPAEKIEEKGK